MHLKGLSARANTKQCKTCRYWDIYNKMCDYFHITGMLRECEPSPNCTKYEKGKKEKAIKAFNLQYWGEGKEEMK